MLSNKGIIRLSVIFSIVFWLLFTIVDTLALVSAEHNIAFGLPHFVSNSMLAFFIISVLIFYKIKIERTEGLNFVDLLWKVFVFGLITTLSTLVIEFFFSVFSSHKLAQDGIVVNLLYHINIGLIIGFLISTFVSWKKLILYQKSKSLVVAWQMYEYCLIGALIFDLFNHSYQDPIFMMVYTILAIIGLVLSFNLKWIAYLNFKQKWRSILFILLVLIYIWYFFKTLLYYSEETPLIRDLLDSSYLLSMVSFIVIYAIISLLVILFNLPTTSVFERKMAEAVNFQRLSQSIPAGESEERVYEILIESATSAVYCQAAWLEINDESKDVQLILTNNIDQNQIPTINYAIQNSPSKKQLTTDFIKNEKGVKVLANLKNVGFKSALKLPLKVKKVQIGTLVLLKEVADGFNKEMIDIVDTFVNQASVSIENFRLLREAISNERYKEELKIATRVQNQLLPKILEKNPAYDIHAFTMAADEVGGDYYDVFKLDDHRTVLIIGDVSGKGTSAAFHMAQMKGVFHSLVQLDLDPMQFMVYANAALSRCLENTSFITVSYFVIDGLTKKVNFARAGHAPSLLYNAADKHAYYFKNKGLGLGILRNSSFDKYVQVNEFEINTNDVLVLYTDGVTEACNENKEQFGADRLLLAVSEFANQSPENIQKGVIKKLYDFCNKESLDDDYTLLIVKFN